MSIGKSQPPKAQKVQDVFRIFMAVFRIQLILAALVVLSGCTL